MGGDTGPLPGTPRDPGPRPGRSGRWRVGGGHARWTGTLKHRGEAREREPQRASYSNGDTFPADEGAAARALRVGGWTFGTSLAEAMRTGLIAHLSPLGAVRRPLRLPSRSTVVDAHRAVRAVVASKRTAKLFSRENSRRVLARAADDGSGEAETVFDTMSRESDTVESTVAAFEDLETDAQAEFLSSLLKDINMLSGEIEFGRAVLEESRRIGEAPRPEDIATVIEKERRLALLEVRAPGSSCASAHLAVRLGRVVWRHSSPAFRGTCGGN